MKKQLKIPLRHLEMLEKKLYYNEKLYKPLKHRICKDIEFMINNNEQNVNVLHEICDRYVVELDGAKAIVSGKFLKDFKEPTLNKFGMGM
jgi:hypothetical protein